MKKHVKNWKNANHLNWQNIQQLCCKLVLPLLLWGVATANVTAINLDYCPCIDGGYNIGTPNDPSGVTNLGSSGLPAGGVSDACISVNGKLRITLDYTFTNCGFVMNEGAEIEVVSGKTLTILSSSLVGCLKMWKGITVTTNGKIIMESSTVRDAQYAFKMLTNSNYRLANNTFDANYVGFYVPTPLAGSNNIQPIAGTTTENAFTKNRFQFTTSYLPPYAGQSPLPGSLPYAGVLLNNVNGFRIGHQNNGSIVNYFSGIRHGIVDNFGIQNIYTGLNVTNLSSISTTDGTGVYISKNLTKISVKFSEMTEVQHGVYGFNSKELEIVGNTNISAITSGITVRSPLKGALIQSNIITMTPPNQYSTGNGIIILQSSNGTSAHQILSNTITTHLNAMNIQTVSGKVVIDDNILTLNNTVGGGAYGILGNGWSGPTTIKGNTITGSASNGAGISLINCKNSQIVKNIIYSTGSLSFSNCIFTYDTPQTLYCCNQLSNAYNGAVLGGASNDTKFANNYFGSFTTALTVQYGQISPQPNHGNSWEGANTTLDASYLGPIQDISNSLFTTATALVPNGYTKISVPPGAMPSQWFIFQGTDPTCGSQVNCGVPPFPLLGDSPNDINGSTLTSADLSALTPPTSIYTMDEVLNWKTQRYLYQKLTTHPSLANWSAAVTSFYNNAQNGPVGQFYSVHEGIRTLGFPPSSMNASYEQLLQDIATETDAHQLDLKLQDLASMDAQIATWKSNRINELVTELNAITTSAQYQQSEKDILLLYLQTVAQDITSFTAAQQSAIDALANQCTLDAGPGVYWARMMRQYYAEGWEWLDDCAPLAYRSKEPTKQPSMKNGITVFPNPSNGQITVSIAEPLTVDSSITIYDMQGRALASKPVLPGETETNLATNQLPNGIYLVKILTNGKAMSTVRVAILH